MFDTARDWLGFFIRRSRELLGLETFGSHPHDDAVFVLTEHRLHALRAQLLEILTRRGSGMIRKGAQQVVALPDLHEELAAICERRHPPRLL